MAPNLEKPCLPSDLLSWVSGIVVRLLHYSGAAAGGISVEPVSKIVKHVLVCHHDDSLIYGGLDGNGHCDAETE